jgi:hypothetical protein
LALIAAFWLVLSAVIAPEHVHEADHNHANAIIHRHIGSHDHAGAEISDDADGPVVWLDPIAISQATFRLAIVLTTPSAGIETPSQPVRWLTPRRHGAPLPHGPPQRTHGVRGPPLSV